MRTIEFTLPEPTKLLNEVLRMHWSARGKYQRRLSWEVRIALGQQRPAAPFTRAKVRIERHSSGVCDHDNFVGGAKFIVDCLLPPGSPRMVKGKPVLPHPCGLSIIADDNPGCMVSEYVSLRTPRGSPQRTFVVIEELPTVD